MNKGVSELILLDSLLDTRLVKLDLNSSLKLYKLDHYC